MKSFKSIIRVYVIAETLAESEKLTLTPGEEDILAFYFHAVKDDVLQQALARKNSGHFNKLATLYDISKWYEEKGFVTRKQYDFLKKSILDKPLNPKLYKDLL